ncbi:MULTISPECIES: hypothetical protein [Streptacidiphilus]|uniref:Uncharacterized protein n=1 Tax=Streptacidiphilus cavernicola TaxID=3342716 RepID=A0ABV6UW49_9ACTN|nr:hypothetical protein [Streptacidiphilus jeojiense]
MSAGEQLVVARSYTRARRWPWVLGKLGELRLPLGPYTPAQLAVAGVGTIVLIRSYAWWAPVLGPLPVALLGLAVWAARSARIGGRVPAAALWGIALALAQPRAGRIAGRTARDRPRADLLGGFHITDTVTGAVLPRRAVTAAPHAQRFAQSARTDAAPVRSTAQSAQGVGVQTALQRLLAAQRDQ